MKKLLLIISLLIIQNSFAQKKTEDLTYPVPFAIEKIDSASGTKDELYVRASEWIAKTFVSAKDVIQMSDKESGKIIAKGSLVSHESGMLYTAENYVRFTLSIDMKNHKYRIRFSDFYLSERYGSGNGSSVTNYNIPLEKEKPYFNLKLWKKIRSDSWAQANEFLNDLTNKLNSKTENW